MDKKYMIFGLALLVIFVAGCTAQCPAVKCPTCSCPKCTTTTTTTPESLVFVYFIDVGQGDAILIKSGEMEMLVDCGRSDSIVDFLKSKNIGDLEYLMMTHPDTDHIGGCDSVLQSFKVHSVITNGEKSDTASYMDVMDKIDTEQIITANKGNSWNIGPAEMRVIQSNNGLSDTNENSIVSKLTYGTMDILFTGDCDNKCEQLLLDDDIQSEILKVAHHGTKFATSAEFLDKVMPQVAIISVGENSYGHPAQETLDRLADDGVAVYRTDNGSIIIKLGSKDYEIVS